MALIDDLLLEASNIRDAEQDKENTALRVGTMLVDILQYIAGFVSVEGLQAVLADYAPLQGALVHWRNSRVVCLASMGTDLDNIDGGDWQYSNHTGDIVFNPSGRNLSIVGEQGNYSVFPGVFYVNLHSRHCYVWDSTTQAMIEITDSSRPTIIDYRNNPPFAQVAIGESYYFESGSAKKIAIKTSSSGSYSFDPDPKKIYVFKDTCESMIWNATTRSWIAIGKNIEVVDNLTEGGRNKALSAEMGKEIKALIDAYESRIDALEESGAALVSVEGTTLVISRMDEPVVIVGDLTKDALTAVAGGESATSDFFVSGRNLEGRIDIALSDATNFSVVPPSLVPVDGKVQTTMVSVKFNPAAGLAAGSTHRCTVTVSYGGETKKTMTIDGTVAASASVSLNPASLTLRASQGAQTSGTITLQGVALSGDVTLDLSGTGLSFDDDATTTRKTVSRADAESGTPITIYYTAGASDVNGSLTATSGSATASAEVKGKVAVRLGEGSYFDVPVAAGGTLRYTVLADNTTVSVKKGSTNPVGTAANPLVIPSTICDDNASAVYNSGGGTIEPGGMTYNVVETTVNAFENCSGIVAVRFNEGFVTLGQGTFGNCANLKTVILPNSLQRMNGYVFNRSGLEEVEIPACVISTWGLSGASLLAKVTFNGTTLGNTSIGRNTHINEIHINGCDQSVSNWTNPFDQCTQFTDGSNPEVHIDSLTPPDLAQGATLFPKDSNNKIQATLYVPANSVSSYTNHVYWGQFNSIVAEPSNN